MKNKIKKFIGFYLLLFLGLLLILIGYVWYINKQNLVRLNLAQPSFPYAKYSDEELEEKFPQYPNEKVATVQTPEQTYAKFIEALKRGDVEGMLVNFTERKRNEYREFLLNEIKEKKLNELLNRLDKTIYQIESFETIANYSFQQGRKDGDSFIEFVKDLDGVWKIDSL